MPTQLDNIENDVHEIKQDAFPCYLIFLYVPPELVGFPFPSAECNGAFDFHSNYLQTHVGALVYVNVIVSPCFNGKS